MNLYFGNIMTPEMLENIGISGKWCKLYGITFKMYFIGITVWRNKEAGK